MALYVDQIHLAQDRTNLAILCKKKISFKMWPSEVERPVVGHECFGYSFPFSSSILPWKWKQYVPPKPATYLQDCTVSRSERRHFEVTTMKAWPCAQGNYWLPKRLLVFVTCRNHTDKPNEEQQNLTLRCSALDIPWCWGLWSNSSSLIGMMETRNTTHYNERQLHVAEQTASNLWRHKRHCWHKYLDDVIL